LGSEVVPATLLDTPAGHFTRGHRFHAPRPIRIASPGSYERTLRERGHVLADLAARRERIQAEVTAAAANASGSALVTTALLDEVTALAEWPVALTGRFEERFLALPREVLISTLAHHQRYFPVENASGRLLPAAELGKCDLLTHMVGEFPDLQGIMGSYYARADGEPEEVAAAIREHYLPRAAGDSLPSTRTGVALAIADKLDSVAGIFAIGEKPTGNKDPFGLRRAALGVQRILIEKGLDLDLKGSIARALAAVRPAP